MHLSGNSQVHEKKVRMISDMNIDPPKAGNGVASSSIKPKSVVDNGSSTHNSNISRSNDFKFPQAGIPCLRLPVVGLLSLSLRMLYQM